MKSIRLSLVVYFIVLLGGSLGAVSWLLYESTSRTLRKREQNMRDLVDDKYKADCTKAKADLDQRLLSQAQTLGNLARTSTHHFEGLYPLGMLGAAPLMQGHLLIPLWLAEGTHPEIMARLHLRPQDFHIESPDALIPDTYKGDPQEYFQIFRGQTALRSESLGEQNLTLTDEAKQHADNGYFDTIDLDAGSKIRRVTLKVYVPRTRSSKLPITWRLEPRRPFGKGPVPKGPAPKNAPPTPPQRTQPNFPQVYPGRYAGFEFPFVYIQYASEVSALNKQIEDLTDTRNSQFTELENATQSDLAGLRQRLLWISLATFLAILTGSLVVIRLGLAPLSRLSDAVSKVSARDFRLQINTQNLPRELVPIADRLSHTLEELGKAFTREKQAAADISHELRTPLAALLTTVEVALRKPRSATEYREMFQDCRLSGQQMMHLVERLLALARLDAGAEMLRPAPLDVADLANQCATMVRPLAEERGLTLTVHVEGPISLQADAGKLREVLNNLLHNAIQYNKPAGSIDLTVERENGHLLMEVRDTGIGIPPASRARIFERFYRADPSRHSEGPHAGLGLAIVKSYIDLMGGRISVDSDAEGSAFRIEVPAVEVT